ncbi:TPA: hypothetical protein RQL00_001168 [Vibrio vulnificus]|nr:hypothetical protein [Vibrio vulnificus]
MTRLRKDHGPSSTDRPGMAGDIPAVLDESKKVMQIDVYRYDSTKPWLSERDPQTLELQGMREK